MTLPKQHLHDTDLTCSNCSVPITRGSRTGLCFPCFHKNNDPETAAKLASRRYFEAVETYRDKYERRAS